MIEALIASESKLPIRQSLKNAQSDTHCIHMETISKHLEDLLAFHVVARERSFTRAADALATSKSVLSKQVQRLEAMVGSQLLIRTTRSVRTTEEGALLFGYSQRILELSDEADSRLKDQRGGPVGVVRISTPDSLGDAFFPSFLGEMRDKLPGVSFEADLTNEFRDLERDRIDFAIRATDQDEELVAKPLGTLRDVICCVPKLGKQVKGRDPKVLEEHECILTTANTIWNSWTLRSKKSGEHTVRVSGRAATNQYGAARLFALHGLGIARIPYYVAEDDIRAGRLVQLFPEYSIATHPLYLTYLRSRYPTQRHVSVKTAILSWFKARPGMFL